MCSDVDECDDDNGGCSISPRVPCRNLEGGVECGPCPEGYTGDGRTCTFRGRCATHNGGCSQLARCLLLPSSFSSGVHSDLFDCTTLRCLWPLLTRSPAELGLWLQRTSWTACAACVRTASWATAWEPRAVFSLVSATAARSKPLSTGHSASTVDIVWCGVDSSDFRDSFFKIIYLDYLVIHVYSTCV